MPSDTNNLKKELAAAQATIGAMATKMASLEADGPSWPRRLSAPPAARAQEAV
eukprot:gene8272-7601_t